LGVVRIGDIPKGMIWFPLSFNYLRTFFASFERQYLAAPRTPPLETVGTEVYLTVKGPFIVACGTLDGWVNGFHDIAYSFNELL